MPHLCGFSASETPETVRFLSARVTEGVVLVSKDKDFVELVKERGPPVTSEQITVTVVE